MSLHCTMYNLYYYFPFSFLQSKEDEVYLLSLTYIKPFIEHLTIYKHVQLFPAINFIRFMLVILKQNITFM